MSALLETGALQILARPIAPPRYDNTRLATAGLWIRDNYEALKHRYIELGRALPDDEDGSLEGFAKAQRFLSFCLCQWDRARGAL